LKAGQNQNQKRNPMAETVFAGKNVIKFLFQSRITVFDSIGAHITPFAENFFLRYRPGNRGDNHRKNNEPKNLF
jgi:hypothetical protein